MIYACAFWPSDPEDHAANMKKTYGFADSKQLTEEQRERLFEISNKCPIHKTLTNTVKINSELI